LIVDSKTKPRTSPKISEKALYPSLKRTTKR